jgi:uncharacterized protein GlcG (DUF336 family)
MLTLAQAKHMIAVSEDKAKELDISITTAVVDEHGTLIALSKMDGALLVSPDFAKTKAITSAALGSPTSGLGAYVKEGNPYFGLNTLQGGIFTPIAGGMPVKMAGKVVGGIGVGGSMDPSQDEQCAQAGVESL